MSQFSIKQYQSEVEKIIHFGGTKKETAIRNAFYNLLNEYAKQKGLMVVPEVTIRTKAGKNVTPDGTLKDTLRQDWGYWESKDESDKIDDEIKKKFDKGYPKDSRDNDRKTKWRKKEGLFGSQHSSQCRSIGIL